MGQILLVALITDRRFYSEETFTIKDTDWNISISRCSLYTIGHLRLYTTHEYRVKGCNLSIAFEGQKLIHNGNMTNISSIIIDFKRASMILHPNE